jgi:hypothetical protein
LGFRPTLAIFSFGIANTICPEEIAFLMIDPKSGFSMEYFLTGAPVKSLR